MTQNCHYLTNGVFCRFKGKEISIDKDCKVCEKGKELEKYRDQFTAEMWRTGQHMSGETFHAWLKEMVKISELDYASLQRYYDEIKQTYCRENELIPTDMNINDYVALTKRVEDAIVKVTEYNKQHTRKKRKKTIWQRIKRRLRIL